LKIKIYRCVSLLCLLVLITAISLMSFLAPTNAMAGALSPASASNQSVVKLPVETDEPTPAPMNTNANDEISPAQIFLPIVQIYTPIRAMRLDYPNYADSRDLVVTLEQQMKAVGINMVALGAGRVEWTYFKWVGHEDSWANDVKDTGIDFLYDDSTRFNSWAHTNAVVDVFAPNYIREHPDKAAISVDGERSQNLVSFTELVHGEFGRKLLEMIEYIAANYPVDSISITELYYHRDGYGPDDKAAYMAYSGNNDWPRYSDGTINTFDSSIGNWRSHELDTFLDEAVLLAHQHGKQLFMDVELSLEDLSFITNEHGTNYNLVLEHMDRIVVWGYYGVDHYAPEYLEEVARFLSQYSQTRLILSVGLWSDTGGAVSPESFRTALQSIRAGGVKNIWITPSILMSDPHWLVLRDFWGGNR
jgi:hypothetical protein